MSILQAIITALLGPTRKQRQEEQQDVEAMLTDLATEHDEELDWRNSVVDLLKVLDLDSSMTARKELAGELGYQAEDYRDTAERNLWLHRAVMKELAKNGGQVPSEWLDD